MVHEDFENRSLGDDKRNESIPPVEFSGKFVKIENVTVHFTGSSRLQSSLLQLLRFFGTAEDS
jgi:hypothetical protein